MSGKFYAQAACTGGLLGVGPRSNRSDVERVMGAALEEHGDECGLLLYYGLVEFHFNGPDPRICTAVLLNAHRIEDETDVPPAIRTNYPGVWGRVPYAEFATEVRALGHETALEKDDGGYRYYVVSGADNRAHVVSDRSRSDYDCVWGVELVEKVGS